MNPDALTLWPAPRWALAVLLACLGMLGPFSIDTYIPAFTGIGEAIGATPVEMQQTLSAYLFGFALMNLFHGALSDSFGRRPVVLWGLLLFTLSSIGCALSQHIGALVFFRAVQGMSAGAGIVVSRAVIRDMFPPADAQRVMSQVTIYFGVAPAVAPMVGGFLFVHFNWHAIFWFLTVVGVLLWALNYRYLPETLHLSQRQPFNAKNLMQGYREMATSGRFMMLALASGVPFNGVFLYVLAAPVFLGQHLRLSPGQFFWFFLTTIAGIMGGSWLSGRLAGRIKRHHQIRHGFLIMVLVSVLNLVLNLLFEPQIWWALPVLGAYAFGWALMVPVVTLMVLDLMPERRGLASSFQACIGSVANGLVAGLIAPLVMHSTTLLAVASLLMMSVGVLAWIWVKPAGDLKRLERLRRGAASLRWRLEMPGAVDGSVSGQERPVGVDMTGRCRRRRRRFPMFSRFAIGARPSSRACRSRPAPCVSASPMSASPVSAAPVSALPPAASTLPVSKFRMLRLLPMLWTALAATAFAADHAAPHAPAEPPVTAAAAHPPTKADSATKPAAAAAAKPVAEAPTAAKPPPRPDPLQNPIDRLRERLAQRLGAAPAPGADKDSNLLRVVSKSSPGSGFEHDLVTSGAAAGHGAPVRNGARHSARSTSPALPAAPAMSGTVPGQARWDYAGENSPASWGQLKPEFSKCASGSRQSPIDIRDGIRVDLDPVAFDYKPGGFRVVDNGHTVQVNVAPGNSIEIGGRRYDLIQFHFHRPSEERINGKQFDMVVHLLHRDLEGRMAMIAVLLDRGSALQAVQTVWNNLPLERGDETLAQTLLDPGDLLPSDRSYYTYMGSLTTPPCSEGVLWMVMKKPMPISADQIGIFARLYPMNARPIQASSGRLIKESN